MTGRAWSMSPGVVAFWSRTGAEAVRAGNDGLAVEVAGQVAEGGGLLDLVAVYRCVADVAVRALAVLHTPPDLTRGQRWVLTSTEGATNDQLFAVRLVTAYANRDSDMVTALVAAVAEAPEDERVQSLRSLMTYAAGCHAQAAHYRSEGTETS
ncbi:hypothetical protein ACFWR6_07175 [Streptomyces griseus]|uniref:hypothetical protein n=1 Tax=Streptomyces griseus TaxID=1911 RepID=UPI00364C78B5